ncbi:MAG: hypothetical protein NZ576_04970, partial [Bacteroidia bacterium]|nr:hypothetical protein [Bacteroidia bacterium]
MSKFFCWLSILLLLLFELSTIKEAKAQKPERPIEKKKPTDYNISSRKALENYLEGQKQMQYRDYKAATLYFQRAVEQEPNFIEALYALGVSIFLSSYATTNHGYYFRTNISPIIPFLAKVIRHPKSVQFPMAYYYLGHAYMQKHQYDSAAYFFENCLNFNLKSPLENKIAKVNWEKSLFAKEAIKTPIRYQPINLGDSVNTQG